MPRRHGLLLSAVLLIATGTAMLCGLFKIGTTFTPMSTHER